MNNSAEPFFLTRGVILLPHDIVTGNWLELARASHLTTIATHVRPAQIMEFMRTDEGRGFLDACKASGIQVEHELHAIGELLPRELFAKNPSMFRMNDAGQRTPDTNLCVHSKEALEVVCEHALAVAQALRPTTGRYFFWIDDGAAMCRCPACRTLSDSEQALVVENAILKALRSSDPGATLAHLAYANTLTPPAQIKPEPGIFLEFAPIQRSFQVPLNCQEPCADDPKRAAHAGLLAALAANVEVFGCAGAQVLEYWLDVSLFAGWKRENTIAIPWRQEVFEEDLRTYASFGIRHVTSFACWADGDYMARFGEPPVGQYGETLRRFSARGSGQPCA
ncbi:MAG: DUF4838 domain-containing protein [Lentisphaerae bacterium]|nr:DUF4838 domain-containing protein [Lentisphaerota bacterium]